MKWSEAAALAGQVIKLLGNHCIEISPVGSFRRKALFCCDLEFLIIPYPDCEGLFAANPSIWSRLDELVAHGTMQKHLNAEGRTCWGKKQRRAEMQGECIEFFIVTPPASRGVIELIRTGPSDFSQACVTRRALGGFLPDGWEVANGAVQQQFGRGLSKECESEQEFFDFLGLPFIEPEKRKDWKSIARRKS